MKTTHFPTFCGFFKSAKPSAEVRISVVAGAYFPQGKFSLYIFSIEYYILQCINFEID